MIEFTREGCILPVFINPLGYPPAKSTLADRVISAHRPFDMKCVVVLGLSSLPVPEKISRARAMVAGMTGNPAFPTPVPALTVITASINACETAYITALGGGVDDTASMHAKETAMELQLKLLAAYVESIANANPATAEAVALSAGMKIRPRVGRTARNFYAQATKNPGEIKLATKAVQRSTYTFQLCDNITTGNWETIEQGTRASYVKTGLIPGHTYYFRVSVVDKNGQGPWSDVVSAMAH